MYKWFKGGFMKINLTKKNDLCIIFFIGIVAGTIAANFLIDKYQACNNIFGNETVDRYFSVQFKEGELIKYVVTSRLREIAVIIGLYLVPYSRKLFRWYLGYIGFLFAFVESVIVMQYSYGGCILFVASIFPQYIFYILAILLLIKGLDIQLRKENARNIIIMCIICILLYICGAISESTINYELIKKVLLNI